MRRFTLSGRVHTTEDGVSTRRSGAGAVRRARRRQRLFAAVLAPVLIVGSVGLTAVGAAVSAAAALPAPTATIALRSSATSPEAEAKPFILAGEDAVFDVTLRNGAADANGYNIGFTVQLPVGISFAGSDKLGSPVVYGPGDTLPNSAKTPPLATVPAGMQLWVFEDVSDLPASATYGASITVRPDADVFPVGAEPRVELTGYISGEPELKPLFDGSTGRGGQAALDETSLQTTATDIPVRAVRLTKAEPSAESELLRGVHENQTTYTLTVETTPQGATEAITLVDYLPAGLEFLGCATIDNTRPSSLLYTPAGLSGGTREYPGAGDVATGRLAADPNCDGVATLVSVETIDAAKDAGAPTSSGVYTKVTWTIPPRSGGQAQSFPAASGTPQVTEITYAAAVPLFENTLDFDTDAGGPAPSASSLEQAANLNNNNGPSTRHGQDPSRADDGILYRNTATVSGTYTGAVAPGADRVSSDSDREDIHAMDLRILKSVDTGDGGQFVTGQLATFTLDIATSEYAGATEIVVTDTLPNGLCPAVAGVESTEPIPADCEAAMTGSVTGATVLPGSTYEASTGRFVLRLAVEALDPRDSVTVTYPALMRAGYEEDDDYAGPTSSGDALVNTVEIVGDTIPAAALSDVVNGSGAPAGEPETVWDDSSAAITSSYSTIDKRVLPRDLMPTTSNPDAADACAVAPADGWAQNQDATGDTPFHTGDYVCFELTVDFAQSIDVRNPKVTDFLPAGVRYVDATVYTGPGGTAGIDPATVDTSVSGQRVEWTLGRLDARGDRTVDLGSKLVLHVLGLVTEQTSADRSTLDKPENLMKYQQQNVHGDLYFLRDAAAIQTGKSPTLVKGVQAVDGGAENGFGSDVDGVQVQGGAEVDFRVDLTGGSLPVTDLVVWDLLPAGISASDVSLISDSGTAVDPGQPGYPAAVEDATRSVIVWPGVSLDAAAEDAGTRSLTYRVTMPADVEVASSFVNDASIVRYSVSGSTGVTNTFYPEGSLDTTTRGDDERVPGDDTRDPSDVFTPSPALAKRLVATEVGPGAEDLDPGRNSDGQAVVGELITWEYSVTIPAETTVTDAVLRDRGLLAPGNRAFTYVSSSWSGPSSTGFTFTGQPASGPDAGYLGVLRFPASYTNTTTEPETFSVTLTGYLSGAAASGLTAPTNLRNTASFDSRTWDATRQATVQYISPAPRITKGADPAADVEIGETITYTLTVNGTGTTPTAFDSTVTDTVPVGLIVDTDTFSVAPAGFDPGVETGDGGTITWNLGAVPPTRTITYQASIEPGTGGGTQYVNTAVVTGYTLPADVDGDDTTARRAARTAQDDATVEATRAAIEKQVRIVGEGEPFAEAADAPIGATAEYRVRVHLEPNINYYDPVITDVLPAGVTLIDGTVSGVSASPSTGIAGSWTFAHADGNLTWTYGGDIPFAAEERVLEVTYRALLSNAATADDLDNTAAFAWNRVDGDLATRETIDDTAEVDVLNPVLSIDKQVTDATPQPGDGFSYTVTVSNTGTTAAHRITVTDDVPAGVVVDPETISDGGVLTGADATTGGGTITWTLTGPLSVTSPTAPALLLTYDATLAPSSALTDDATDGVYINTAAVRHYESYPDGGREYDPADEEDSASVDPAFPAVSVTKTVTDGDTAYAGDPFGWTLTLTNTGAGQARITEVRDVLPANWDYDDGSARISVGGGAPVALADPAITAHDAGDALSWSWTSTEGPLLAGRPAGANDPARTLVITFTATPSAAALDTPGVTSPDGTRVPHVNTLSATTVDPTGAEGNADGPYTGPDDEAEAFIGAADLSIVKEASATPIQAGGAAAAAWTLTVGNAGPDTAVGPFVVRDTPDALPDGFTITGLAGDGWTCAPDGAEYVCERSDATETLAAGAAFPPITVTAQATAAFDPDDSPIGNTATVSGRTFDPEPSNDESDDDVTVSTEADLAIVKEGPALAPNAGREITWTIRVTNTAGPSDSLSTEAAPITVTDTIPEGVGGVTVVDLPSGWTSSTTTPIGAGETLTLTQDAGGRIPAGGSVVFTLTGTVDADFADGDEIRNEATVEPGATTDPDEGNNTDDTTTTPTTDTTLAVVKQRVVQSGGEWVPAVSLSPVPAPVAGDPVSYLITVTNTGPAVARGVEVRDELAEYFTFGSFTDVEGTWSVTPGSGSPADAQTFALAGGLAPGAAASLRVTLLLDEAHTGDVVNAVEAAGDNVTNEPTDTDDSSGLRSADWGVEKSHTGTAVAGESLEYTVTATQHGPSSSSGPVTVVDVLPEGFAFVEGSATVATDGGAPVAAAPSVSGRELTWAFGAEGTTYPVGTEMTIVFRADIAPDVPAGPAVNRATVDAPEDDDPANDSAEDPATVVTRAGLGLSKSAAAGPHRAGETVSYDLVVTNHGPSVARDVVVDDLLPAGLTATAIRADDAECDLAAVRCTIDELPIGSSTIVVTARIDQGVAEGTELTNAAEVTSSTPDDDPSDNRDEETITVIAEADLAIVKTAVDADGAEVDRVAAGDQLRYTLQVSNRGPSAAVGPVRIDDVLPDGFSFVSVVGGGDVWSCAEGAGAAEVACAMPGGLAAGAEATVLTLLVKVDADRAEGDATNVATVGSPTTDPTPENNVDDATVTVVQEADLTIVKSHAGTARIGADLTFDLQVTNQGPSTATGVTVVDTIPAGLELVEATSPGDAWTIDIRTGDAGTTILTAELTGPLASGADAPPLRVTTTVTVGAHPGVVNTAEVDADQDDPDRTDNRSDDQVAVPPLASLQLEKNAIGVLEQGEDGVYEITVTNAGPTEDPGPITIVDELPTGLSFVSASGAADCVDSSGRVACVLDRALAAGESFTLRLIVAVGFDAPETITNIAGVESATDQVGAKMTASDVSPVVQHPLPGTGGMVPWSVLVLALALVGLGVLLRVRKSGAMRRS